MTAFDVPGLGLAVVKDGEVLLARGFGVKRAGGADRVGPDTLFGIASNTKAFTATALGLLVEKGKIEWDAGVLEYLPSFQLSDPVVTREITVRDLLVHRSGLGLGAGDLLLWPPSLYTRKDIVRRLRFIPLATSFRSAYAYDNVLYLVAGEVIEAASGLAWEDFVREEIFVPIGMTRSRVRHPETREGLDIAEPHAAVEGSLRVVPPAENDNINPAGGILSSAADMAKWTIVQLGEGRLPSGSRLFSEATAKELQTLVTPMPSPSLPAELADQKMNFRGYALGFQVHDYRGRKVVTHTGGLSGYVSKLTMIPGLELGVVVLTNQESGEAFNAITYSLLDHFLGVPQTDWVGAYLKVRERGRTRSVAAAKKIADARNAASRPSLDQKAYAGSYRDAWYGDIGISLEDGGLVMRFGKTPGLVGDLEHWQHDTFIVRWRDRGLRADAFVIFSLDPLGQISEARMKPVSPDTDFSYDFQDLLLKPVANRKRDSGRSP
jgi:CubicO group peptidase (beta-lactamase class C family)